MLFYEFKIGFLDEKVLNKSLYAESYVVAWEALINKLWRDRILPQVAYISLLR